jgi:integrase
MRRGEQLALRWADTDLERGTLAVRRNLARGADGLVFGEPKTKAGRRSITIPAPVVAALRAHRAKQNERRLQLGADWQDHDLVFDRGDGTVLHPNVVTKAFARHARRLGLPPIRLHDLRHTAATLMLANGEHPRIVQERLGHSDVSMTLGRYSHVTETMQREAADRLAALLGS